LWRVILVMEMDAETAAVVVKKKGCLEKEAAEEAGEKLSGQQQDHHHRGEGVISDAASTPVLPLAQVLSHFLSSWFFLSFAPTESIFFPCSFFQANVCICCQS
jgi:hypothetical protein